MYYHKELLHYQPPPSYTSILHEAVDGDQPDVVQLLLLYGFNPDLRARGGLTPLHLAVIKANAGCIRALIDNGADITQKDDQGQDAITKAEQRNKKREAALKLLRSKGKTPKINIICDYIILLSRNCDSGKGGSDNGA